MGEVVHNLIRGIKYVPYFLLRKPDLHLEQHNYALIGRLSASLIHDILTPITTLSLGTSLLEKENVSDIKPVIDQSTAQIREFVEIMKNFLKQCDEERLVHVNAEIRKAIRLLSYKATHLNVQIQFLELNQVHTHTHAIYLYQILVNLISNAMDASVGSETKKVLVLLKRQGRSYYIECKDFGSGIPKYLVRKIRKPGYTTKPDGHGFGLYSVKFIVEKRMGGRLSVSSELNEGSLFSCRIPLGSRKAVSK